MVIEGGLYHPHLGTTGGDNGVGSGENGIGGIITVPRISITLNISSLALYGYFNLSSYLNPNPHPIPNLQTISGAEKNNYSE